MIRTVPIPRNGGRLAGQLGYSDQVGCLSWPACVAGGTLCPQPSSFGASLNPCCAFAPPMGICPDDVPTSANSDGSYGVTGAAADAISNAVSGIVSASTGGVPSWLWIAGGVTLALALQRR